jgi:hypothetical protein
MPSRPALHARSRHLHRLRQCRRPARDRAALGCVDGLLTGFQLVAPAGRDASLLALSRQFEKACGDDIAEGPLQLL